MGGNEVREEVVLGEIIRIWVNRMPYIPLLERRKLLALALCSLLGPDSPPCVLHYFPLIISNIVGTLNDITKLDDIRCENIGYAIEYVEIIRTIHIIAIKNHTAIKVSIFTYFRSLSISGQSSPSQHDDEEYGNKHEQRKRRLDFSDPLPSISLKDTLQNQVKR